MSFQIHFKECNKCKSYKIITIAFGKIIKTENCKCKKNGL